MGPNGGSVAMDSADLNQRYSTLGWSKLDFAERDKCKPVLPRLSIAGNLEKHLCPSIGPNGVSAAYVLHRATIQAPLPSAG
jgi:hypothetical protein